MITNKAFFEMKHDSNLHRIEMEPLSFLKLLQFVFASLFDVKAHDDD